MTINFIQRTTNEDVNITKLPYKSFRVTLIWSTQTFPKYRWPFVYHCTYNNTENLVSCVVVFLPFLASLCEMASLTNAAELSMTARCTKSVFNQTDHGFIVDVNQSEWNLKWGPVSMELKPHPDYLPHSKIYFQSLQ